jgi:hypothetical protein
MNLEWSALLKRMVEECAQTANNIQSYEHLQSVTAQPILSELAVRVPVAPSSLRDCRPHLLDKVLQVLK